MRFVEKVPVPVSKRILDSYRYRVGTVHRKQKCTCTVAGPYMEKYLNRTTIDAGMPMPD
jgi:hypothetical protein